MKHSLFLVALFGLTAGASCQAQNAPAMQPTMSVPAETEATIYSTLPSLTAHRPMMAMDGDPNTYFKSVYGMSQGDDFTVLFSRPLPLNAMRVTTGNLDGDNLLTKGFVEISTDGKTYKRAASFDSKGVASGNLNGEHIAAMRIKVNPGTGLATLLLREITLDSPTKISYIGWGAGRPFSDYSDAPDLKEWSEKADKQMIESWGEVASILYTPGFITPNKVNVVYRGGPDVTPVAANGGGVMTVNIAWARAHPEDTPLTVHEITHTVQSMSAYNPVWLVEGISDYIRWTQFEPQNFKVNINAATAKYSDSYRTTGAFLRWCELNYDSRLVTKLNTDVRFGKYTPAKWKEYTGKDVDTLWAEFLTAYKADPVGIIAPPMAPADRPRALPVVAPGSSVAVDLSKAYNMVGVVKDGATFGAETGFDGGGAAFSSKDVGAMVNSKNVMFKTGAPGANNIVAAKGQTLALPQGQYGSLWMLGAATEGGQRGQEFTVNYSDGSKQVFAQNLSDWYAPQEFVGESRAIKAPTRVLADGMADTRPFSLYSYGFTLDPKKTVQSVTLPDNELVKIAGVSLAK